MIQEQYRSVWFPTTWTILFFLVFWSQLEGVLLDNFDDLSVYRASSYMSRFPDDPLLIELQLHLRTRAEELGTYTYKRYGARLGLLEGSLVKRLGLEHHRNYLAQNWLIGIFEKLPPYSAYQSVLAAKFLLIVIAAVAIFVSFGALFKNSEPLRVSFLLSFVPCIFFYPEDLGVLFPFQSSTFLGSYSAIGWGSFGMAFAALLFWVRFGDSGVSAYKRFGIAVFLSLGSILMHKAVGLMLFGFTLLLIFLRPVVKAPARLDIRRFLLAFNLLIVVTASFKFLFLVLSGATEFHVLAPGDTPTTADLLKNCSKIVSWTIGANLLALGWIRLRAVKPAKEEEFTQSGDLFFYCFAVCSVLALGLNVFHPDSVLRYDMFLFNEISTRMVPVAHLLWWMLFGTWFYRKLSDRPGFFIAATSSALVLLSMAAVCRTVMIDNRQALFAEMFNSEHLTVHSRVLLARAGAEAYASESRYFHAIANELRDNHKSKPIPSSRRAVN